MKNKADSDPMMSTLLSDTEEGRKLRSTAIDLVMANATLRPITMEEYREIERRNEEKVAQQQKLARKRRGATRK